MPGDPAGKVGADGACEVAVVVTGAGADVTAWTGNDVVATIGAGDVVITFVVAVFVVATFVVATLVVTTLVVTTLVVTGARVVVVDSATDVVVSAIVVVNSETQLIVNSIGTVATPP